jgi:lipooligosaccharide transport system permease protein
VSSSTTASITTSVPTGHLAAARGRPRPGAFWRRCLTYWLTSYRRTWRGSVVSGFLAPLLYLGSIGFGLGALVDKGGAPAIEGVPYLAFVAPGVLAATAMQTAVGEATYPVMGAVKWQRQYHAMLAAPLGTVDLVLGHLAFILIRAAIASAFFVAVGAALGAFTSPWAVLGILVGVLCAAAHAAPVMAFSARQDNDGAFNLVFRFGVIPMFLFAGTFFPIDQLPPLIQPLAWATPLWHATNLTRDLCLERVELLPALGSTAYLCAWAGIGIWLAGRSFRSRLVR